MNLLGVKIDNLSIEQALEKIDGFLGDAKSPLTPLLQSGEEMLNPSQPPFTKGGESQHYIVLPYADFLVQAQKDEEFRKILNEADLSLSDGVGPVLASRLVGKEKLRGRVMGVDLVWALADKFSATHGFFLFGGKEGVARGAADRIAVKYPSARIIGTLNGYVSDDEAVAAINNSGAEILLVALGMPKQEKWIYNNLKKLPAVKLAIGVGGSFDFISGRVRRAPRFVQAVGLEWLWRLILQPSQWRKTWRSAVVFSWLVLKSIFQHSCLPR